MLLILTIMILHFTLSTSEIKEVKIVVYRISAFDYDSLYNKLTIETKGYFSVDCMPDNLNWADFNTSCDPDKLIFYNVIEFHCEDLLCEFEDPDPFYWEDDIDYPDPDEAIKAAEAEIIDSLTEDDFPF